MPRRCFAMITPHGDPLGRIGEPDIGGQCVYVRELSAHLAKAGHDVRMYTRDRGEGKPSIEEYIPNATVHRVPCGPAGFIPKEELTPYLSEFVDALRLELPDDVILHSHYWDGGYVADALSGDRPWFHTTHSIGKLKQAALPAGSQYRYDDRIEIETDIYRHCDRVIALTETERGQIRDLYEVPSDSIVVIPPGVNTDVFSPLPDRMGVRSRLGWPDDTLVVFTLGRLDERKGFDLFLKMAGQLRTRASLPKTLFALSAGDGSAGEAAERQKLRDLIEALDLAECLQWIPVLPEKMIPSYYGAADIFVLPSRYEPFGIVMLEAMASELPVVATNVGGPATVIEPEISGLLVNPADTDALADAVARLLLDPRSREEYGRAARRIVESSYSWETIAARHLSAYASVLKEGADER